MFEDIGALEKEINDFRQNILASNDLIRRLDEVVAGIKSQTKSFESSSNVLQNIIEEQTTSLKQVAKDQNEMLLRTAEALPVTMREEMDKFRHDLSNLVTEQMERMIQSNQIQIEYSVQEISEKQKAFSDLVDRTDLKIKKRQDTLDEKYETLLKKLESANLEEAIKLSKKIIKSINVKFSILLTAVGAAISLMLYTLFR